MIIKNKNSSLLVRGKTWTGYCSAFGGFFKLVAWRSQLKRRQRRSRRQLHWKRHGQWRRVQDVNKWTASYENELHRMLGQISRKCTVCRKSSNTKERRLAFACNQQVEEAQKIAEENIQPLQDRLAELLLDWMAQTALIAICEKFLWPQQRLSQTDSTVRWSSLRSKSTSGSLFAICVSRPNREHCSVGQTLALSASKVLWSTRTCTSRGPRRVCQSAAKQL